MFGRSKREDQQVLRVWIFGFFAVQRERRSRLRKRGEEMGRCSSCSVVDHQRKSVVRRIQNTLEEPRTMIQPDAIFIAVIRLAIEVDQKRRPRKTLPSTLANGNTSRIRWAGVGRICSKFKRRQPYSEAVQEWMIGNC